MILEAVPGRVRTEDETVISFIDFKAEKDGLGAYIRFRPGLITSTIGLPSPENIQVHLYRALSPSRVVAVEFVSGAQISLPLFRSLMRPLPERNIKSLWRKYKTLRLADAPS